MGAPIGVVEIHLQLEIAAPVKVPPHTPPTPLPPLFSTTGSMSNEICYHLVLKKTFVLQECKLFSFGIKGLQECKFGIKTGFTVVGI